MIDTPSTFPNQPLPREGKKNKTGMIIVILVAVAAVIGGVFMLRQPKKTDQPVVTITMTQEPSPTAKPAIDKTSVKIQVLNGTGTPGQASTVVEVLKKAGYNPDNIKTANAKEFADTVANITARSGFEDVANDMKDALKTTFDEIIIESAKLDKENGFDIVIVTGGKKYEVSPTATPSATLTPTTTVTVTPTPTSTPTPTPKP